MNVSAWCIRNPIPSVLLFMLLTLAGLLSFNAMRVQSFPDIELPMVTITASLPGANPSQLESEVARKLENSIATATGVKHIYTHITDGTVTHSVEFQLEKPLQEAVDDMRAAVSRVRSDLPAALRDPVVTKVEWAGAPVLSYALSSSSRDAEALSWFVDNNVTKAVLSVKGVSGVNRVGGVSREVRVELDPARMLSLDVSAADISRRLREVQQEAPGGRADLGGAEQTVRTLATVASAAELAQLDVPLSDGRHIRLDQVATVLDTVAEPRSWAALDGKPVVGFEITRARGASEVTIARNLVGVLERLQKDHPDITLTESFNFVEPVQENFDGSMALLYEGAFLAVLVVWAFLRDWRATLVAALALPLSAIPTFAVMYLMGFTLNMVTLLSLSLVVGVLVDDAIVEIENIVRHLADGKTPFQAAMEAADEIGLAVIATTFTLIAVFLPTAFMSGVVGRVFVNFGWTCAIAVFFSLVVARMLTPMMAAYLLRPRGHASEPRWLTYYMRWAEAALRHRLLSMAVVVVFAVACLALAGRLSSGFIPPDDISQSQVTLTLPPGSTLAQSVALTEQAHQIVQANPHVKLIYTAVGGGAAGGDPFAPATASAQRATLTLKLAARDDRPGVSKQDVETQLREALQELPGARVKVGMGGSSEKLVLVLSGDDGDVLMPHAQRVEQELRGIPGIGAVTSTASLQRPELIVRPDAARAADLGVTTSAIADTLRLATAGDYDQGLAKLNLAERQVPIVVRLPMSARQDIELLKRLPVPGARGPVPLGNVADVRLGSGPTEIDHYDRRRNVNFDIELGGQPLGEVMQAAYALPSLTQLPPGLSRSVVGDAEAMEELFSGFALAMLAGVLCIYCVLVLLFHDFVQPVTILAALVLSVPGAILALYATNTALSMPALIGMLMLMGIATKNSILLVDYVILARRDHGLNRWEALLDACRKRARPIIMTTLAMGAGMLPIALGMGVDSSFRSPMAIVVIGGLISSTFLSLLIVPVVFTYIDDFAQWVWRLLRRKSRPAATPADAAVGSGSA